MQADFERELSAKIRTRRLITGCLVLIFLAMFILFVSLRESTKQVIVHEAGFIIPSWTEVNYNNGYILPITLGIMGAVLSGIFLIVDFAMCGFRTVHKDGHDITVCRGITHNTVYVDGQEKGRLGPFDISNVVEVWLSNRVRVTVSFSRVIWYMAHVSFSDDTASREV
ncbi:MAG: hypothetical protein J6V34_01590 [Oscillospiraceae bacterium]|nr:hypothetical protein [Oscillospiraceae bacterium]